MARHRLIFLGAALAIVTFGAAVLVTTGPDIISRLASAPQCREAAAMADAVAPFAIGDMAAFSAIEPVDVSALPYDEADGQVSTIAALEGRTTLFNLWATWCAPCRAEMPTLAALHEREGGPDFQVVATSIDHNEVGRPEDFLTETNAEALAYHREPTLSLFNSLRDVELAHGMPTTLLIAPDGCAAGVLHGAAHWDSDDAVRLIAAARAAMS